LRGKDRASQFELAAGAAARPTAFFNTMAIFGLTAPSVVFSGFL